MITYEQHLQRILSAVRRSEPLTVRLDSPGWVSAVLGRALTADVISELALPGFTNSAMDGYAVRAADLGAGDGAQLDVACTLPIIGDVAAGDTRVLALEPGRAWRIMTGAPVPAGADTIVPVEQTDGGIERVRIDAVVHAGRHIRVAGDDVQPGDVVLPAGTVVAPQHVAVIASAGVTTVDVAPRPRVVVMTTGDELRPAGSELLHGQIHDSNGPMLAALVAAAGAELVELVHVRDDARDVAAVLERAVEEADVVVTTGGVSAGAYDVVKEALIAAGDVTFDKVAMQPGKPQGFGLLGARRVPVFTLPGNPMSTLVSFHVFVLPALRAMASLPTPPQPRGVAAQGWRTPEGRAQFARVRVESAGERLVVSPNTRQGSHHLGELASADALAVVPAHVTEVRAGDDVDLIMLLGGHHG